jgi:DNA invertase Pin-like site-specific DNA recombinase
VSLKKENVILVNEFSRLGRSMLEVMEIISIAMHKGIQIYTVKGTWQLDDSIQSKVMAMVFAMASVIEIDLISKRTKVSLAAKKFSGIKLGRPTGPAKSKHDQFGPEIEALLFNGSSQKYIARRYRVTEATLSIWIKKNSVKRYDKAA